MSQIEVWGTGKPLTGFTQDQVLNSARKGFPKAKAQHIAQFIAGKRFIIAHVKDEAAAQRLIDGLAKSGIEADTKGPPPGVPAATGAASTVTSPEDEETTLMEELDEPPIPPEPSAVRATPFKHWKIVAGIAALLIVGIAIGVVVMRQRSQASELAAQARLEAQARDNLAAREKAEAFARKQAEADAAAKAKADAAEAEHLAKKEAAVSEINSAFADGNYPSVIALSERFDGMYGPDSRVAKLEDNATYSLKEGARRGNFAAILNAPIKGSVRYEALRQWALQVQERAKPQN